MTAEVPHIAASSISSRARIFLLLALILLTAASLRIYRMNEKSFWYDEFASVELPMGRGYAQYALPSDVLIENPPNLMDPAQARPIGTLWYSELAGHVPPLYIVVMRLWGDALGFSQGSVRSFSLLMSVSAIVALFFAVRELSGTAPALWAALLMALAGPQIQYGQEGRNYAMLLLIALSAAAVLVRIEKRGTTRWRLFALTAFLLAVTLTHYFAIGTLFALAAYALLRLRGPVRMRVIGCFAAVVVLWGVLGAPLAFRHRHNLNEVRSTAFLDDDSPGHLLRTAARFARLPVRYMTEPMTTSAAATLVGVAGFALAVLLPLRGRRDLLLWGLWLWLTVIPLVALDIVRRTQHLEYMRYTLLASPALYALVACATSDSRKRWMRHAVPALVALACLLTVNNAYAAWWKADWRILAAAIDQNVRPGEVIVFWRGDDFEGYPNAAFLHTSYYRRSALGPIVLMQNPADGTLARQLREAPAVWVVALGRDRVADAVPGTTTEFRAYSPGAGGLWRARWTAPATQP